MIKVIGVRFKQKKKMLGKIPAQPNKKPLKFVSKG